MKTTERQIKKITLEGGEIDTFQNIITKLNEDSQKAGFIKNRFNEDEQKLLKELNEDETT